MTKLAPTLAQTSRRQFIAGSSSLLAMSCFSGYLNAAQLDTLKSQFSASNIQSGIAIYKGGDKYSQAFASVFADNGMSMVELGIDPVRQWRDGLAEALASSQQPIIGLTNWSDYQLMRGLAAELRRHPAFEVQHKLHRGIETNWASTYAQDLLTISKTESLMDIQQALAARSAHITNTGQTDYSTYTASGKTAGLSQLSGKSLFSWIIT